MDLEKIGKYIAEKRKALGLTQAQVAQSLGMSDKSVSKWERGICLPDVSVYMKLCEILRISLNEFIAGEDIEQENVVKASEENLIQVTKTGKHLRKRLKWMIAILTCTCGILMVLLMFSCLKEKMAVNYVEPLSEASKEVEIARLLSRDDGAYLYDFNLDSRWTGISLNLYVYEHGTLTMDENLGQMHFGEVKIQDGRIAIVPDFDDFNVRVIVAGDGIKYATILDILEDVEDREYYGRTAAKLEEKIKITEKKEEGLLALIYGEEGVSAFPISEFEKDVISDKNDYVYYITVTFLTE